MINEEQFVKVPMWILKISQVNGHKFTDSAKNLYCYLKGFDRAFPSYAKIGDVFGITPRAAEERVKKLLEMGLIIKDARPGSSNVYQVVDIPQEEARQEAKTQQEATVKAVPEQLPPTEDNKESSFDVLDDWDAPLPWETEETPVSSSEKVANDNEEDVLENFASLICQEKHKRTGGASFIEFANSLACRYGLKRPNGIEAYFSKHYPNVYEDFDIPF
ncbi:TPA: transcriptional regulator [Escherichia coli]|uniref:Transcriptional regulator n=1 Tax=Escherichia coli TaxID=562 RepID=A0A6D2FCH4_ECOLX|nr:transcriptional regulator [Escherichia coli]EEW1745185.1 transcriptional regulator [Escherichia coli]EFE3368159.1 transcriptional regulator [Escherichia coli]EFF0106562.1 transcriptional regulator [Escherichia coli]EFH3774987.1 transcriptional regulator [Escherichia coli]EFH4222146.1 transcriptional regulator [Escherichia coli]